MGSYILVVDDDQDCRNMMRQLASAAATGLEIRTADDGRSAISQMSREAPAIVVLDLMMPVTDGFGVLDWMDAQKDMRHIPVIICSADTVEYQNRLRRRQIVGLVQKGHIDILGFLKLLSDTLSGQRAATPSPVGIRSVSAILAA